MSGTMEFPEFVRRLPKADMPFPNVSGWLVQGDTHQVAFIAFDNDTDVPEHSHEEQWEIPVAGRALLRMRGEEKEFGPGDTFFIPSGVPHSARVSAGYQAVIVFNAPDRYRIAE